MKNRLKMVAGCAVLFCLPVMAGQSVEYTVNGEAMGYCFGGTAVLELARSGEELKGFVTFHGGLDLPEGQNCSSTKGKVLILHGSADTGITIDKFAALIGDLEKAGVPYEGIPFPRTRKR